MTKLNLSIEFIRHNSPRIALLILLTLFLITSGYFAINLKTGIIPDEPAHFTFSKHFASEWGIPPDTYETYSWGWYIEQNPFLYYWINGRIINIIELTNASATDWQLLVSLRLINVIFSLGTILFCFLISKELIHSPWWQLVPVFLLTNTLMFVFLSGGLNYDNLANLLSTAGLYFLVRVFTREHFIKNTLSWIIMVGLGTLVKYTILPLALAMSLSWLLYTIKFRKTIFPIRLIKRENIILGCVAISVILGNFAIYGINLIRYQSITPPCREILLEAQCEISPYEERASEIANQSKLSIKESIAQGYPSPIRYATVDWVYNMLMRSFGMIGHKSYFPTQIISLYQILFYGILSLGVLNLLIRQQISFLTICLIFITGFYAIVLLFQNYNSELIYNFNHIAFQGRYIFPIISIIYVLSGKIINKTPIWILRMFVLIVTISIFFYGGTITFLRGYNSFLLDWFI